MPRLRHPGGTGDDWRVHFAYDLTAGRMDEVVVTDQHSAERLAHFTLRPRDIAVVDNGYGYRASVATAAGQDADVVLRITPATFPVETAAGVPCDLIAWLRQGSAAQQEWQGYCVHDGHTMRSACWRPACRPRPRRGRPAQVPAGAQGGKPSAATLTLADWVLVATTLGAAWSLRDVLRLYRARWQVDLVFKRMKQPCGSTNSAVRTAPRSKRRCGPSLSPGPCRTASSPSCARSCPPRRWAHHRTHPRTRGSSSAPGGWWGGLGDAAATGPASVVAGPTPDLSPPLTSLSVQSAASSRHQETVVRAWLEGRIPRGHSLRTRPHEQYGLETAP